jgi:hypothetical protein
MGMVIQFGKFFRSLAAKSKPIRDLLSTKNQFYWGSDQQEAFDKVKLTLTNTPVLAHYDPNWETVLMTDSSKYATGSVVLQKQDNGAFKPVSFASRAFTPTEVRYSVLEKEALNVVTGAELPVRVQRFRMRLLRFSYSISFVPGKLMYIPDYLSRAECDTLTFTDYQNCNETEMYVDSVVISLPATEKKLEEIKSKQKTDYVCSKLIEYT